jgi:hypothetical protein
MKESIQMNEIAETHQDDELSLFDLFDFVRENWLGIAVSGTLGVLLATVYLFVAPPVYEAQLQLEMARISADSGNRTLGVPVEQASLLVERLRLPSTYKQETAQACAVENARFPFDELAERVNARTIKGLESVVELIVRGESPEAARSCAAAVFEMVRLQQNALLHPYINEARENTAVLQARLKDNQEFLAAMEKTAVQSAVYLAKRDESLWLMDRIANLERSLRQTFETRLVSPIYSAPHAVSPRKAIILVVGAFAGLLLGIVLAFFRKQVVEWRGHTRK